MKARTIKISENIYNSELLEGSICENCIIIKLSEHNIEKVTRDSVLSAIYRRSFIDKNLNVVSIEIISTKIEKVDELIGSIDSVASDNYEVVKDRNFNLEDYLNKLTITFSDDETEYEVSKDDLLGSIIMDLSGLKFMTEKSNKEIINSIEI